MSTTTPAAITTPTLSALSSSSSSSAGFVATSNAPLKAARSLLGKKMKCTLDDGRTVTGTFICLDRLKNLILSNVVEERWVDTSNYSIENKGKGVLARRDLSQAMIPGFRLRSVEMDKSILDNINNNNKNDDDDDDSSSSSSIQNDNDSNNNIIIVIKEKN